MKVAANNQESKAMLRFYLGSLGLLFACAGSFVWVTRSCGSSPTSLQTGDADLLVRLSEDRHGAFKVVLQNQTSHPLTIEEPSPWHAIEVRFFDKLGNSVAVKTKNAGSLVEPPDSRALTLASGDKTTLVITRTELARLYDIAPRTWVAFEYRGTVLDSPTGRKEVIFVGPVISNAIPW
jgi:hypothetical protein